MRPTALSLGVLISCAAQAAPIKLLLSVGSDGAPIGYGFDVIVDPTNPDEQLTAEEVGAVRTQLAQTFGLCVLTSLLSAMLPARKAARMSIAEALRYD